MFCDTYVVMETGSQVWIFGSFNTHGADRGFVPYQTPGYQIVSYPTADYKIDGTPCESLTKNAVYQSAYLASHYSPSSKTIRGQHREDRLLQDTNSGIRDPQD